MFTFDPKNIAVAIVGLTTLAWGFIVFLSDSKNRTNRVFFIFSLSIFSWIFTMLMFRGVESDTARLLWARLLYFAAATIPPTLLTFAYVFTTEDYYISRVKKAFIYVPLLIISFISLYPNLLIKEVIYSPTKEDAIIFTNWLHWLYAIHINVGFFWIYAVLGKKWRNAQSLVRTQIGYVIAGTLGSTLVGVTTNLTLPLQGNFTYNWLGQVTIIIMVTAIFYAILRHRLFDAKVIATEIFTFSLWGFILFRTVLSEGQDQVLNAILLAGTILIGIFLIRSVIKEVRTRENLDIANKTLERLNLEKSEFLSIASHQLKSPPTIIRNYVSMIIENSYGVITEKIKEILGTILYVNQQQIDTVEDFLNISRIEQGKMEYSLGPVDMKKMVIDIVTNLNQIAHGVKIDLSYEIKDEGDYTISADIGKIRHVVSNIVDNSIKYGKKDGGGFTKIVLSKDVPKKIVRIDVTDNGVGMSAGTIGRLFQRFSRAKDVGKSGQSGSGLGLYIARQMVETHGGRIWATSPGEGQGSAFGVELPFSPTEEKRQVVSEK